MHFRSVASTLFALSLGLTASVALVAQTERPPIIDRELFFGNPEIEATLPQMGGAKLTSELTK